MDLDILDPAFAGDTSCAGQFGRCMAFLPKTPSSASFGKTGILVYFGHRSRTFWTPAPHNCFRDPDIMDTMDIIDTMDLDILDSRRAYHFHISHTLATFRFSGRRTMDFMDNMDTMDCTGKLPLPLFSPAFAGDTSPAQCVWEYCEDWEVWEVFYGFILSTWPLFSPAVAGDSPYAGGVIKVGRFCQNRLMSQFRRNWPT